MTRRSPPEASVTASVVSVATRPAPANSVARYWPTLTANPTATAISSGRASIGSLTRTNVRRREAPRLAAACVMRESNARHGSASDRKTYGSTNTRCAHTTAANVASSRRARAVPACRTGTRSAGRAAAGRGARARRPPRRGASDLVLEAREDEPERDRRRDDADRQRRPRRPRQAGGVVAPVSSREAGRQRVGKAPLRRERPECQAGDRELAEHRARSRPRATVRDGERARRGGRGPDRPPWRGGRRPPPRRRARRRSRRPRSPAGDTPRPRRGTEARVAVLEEADHEHGERRRVRRAEDQRDVHHRQREGQHGVDRQPDLRIELRHGPP